jgi:hypothetical protein
MAGAPAAHQAAWEAAACIQAASPSHATPPQLQSRWPGAAAQTCGPVQPFSALFRTESPSVPSPLALVEESGVRTRRGSALLRLARTSGHHLHACMHQSVSSECRGMFHECCEITLHPILQILELPMQKSKSKCPVRTLLIEPSSTVRGLSKCILSITYACTAHILDCDTSCMFAAAGSVGEYVCNACTLFLANTSYMHAVTCPGKRTGLSNALR